MRKYIDLPNFLWHICLWLFVVIFAEENLCAQSSTFAGDKSRPNILLILADDQGYHDVSYYGTKDLKTPNIDKIAHAGMRFDNFYATPVCAPSRANLLSGRYPGFVGVPGLVRQTNGRNNWGYLDPNAILLPTVLKKAGYNTGMVGKWNLGLKSPNLPNDRGFDYYRGWLADMMNDYWKHRRWGKNYMRLNKKIVDPKGHATNLFTKWAQDYIKKQANSPNPFFLYLAYTAPHFPIQPPPKWLEMVEKREPQVSTKRSKLVALIEQMDGGIGQVIKTLKQTGQYKNTLIIFTSDNGGRLRDGAHNGINRRGKQSVYEGGLRVPAAIEWPGHIEKGSSAERVCMLMDIFPTLVDIAGINYEGPLEGVSFLPTLKGEKQPKENRPLFFTRREGGTRYGGLTIQAVRLGKWKLLQNSPFRPQELYNLQKDPMEQNNVIYDHPRIFHQLNALMMRHLQKEGQVPWQRPDSSM